LYKTYYSELRVR